MSFDCSIAEEGPHREAICRLGISPGVTYFVTLSHGTIRTQELLRAGCTLATTGSATGSIPLWRNGRPRGEFPQLERQDNTTFNRELMGYLDRDIGPDTGDYDAIQ